MTIRQRDCNSAISLERRLAAYAMAGGAMLATAETAQAAVIYSGLQNIPIGVDQTVNMDLNGLNGDVVQVNDFSFQNVFGTIAGDFRDLNVISQGANRTVFGASSAAALDAGETISGSSSFAGGQQNMAGYKNGPGPPVGFGGPYGDWFGVSNKFLGLEFTIGSETHYGWARLSVSNSENTADAVTATLHDWAYEDVALASITTGAVPEPNSLALLALGAAGVGLHLANRRRGQKLDAATRD